MERQLELHCRDELRDARAAVLRDAEAFPEILFAIERTGAALTGKSGSFKTYRSALLKLAGRSPAANGGVWNQPCRRLYNLVWHGRNEALHQGAFARHLADNAVELALVLEDALTNGSDIISDYMVRTPVVAELWQPLRVVRHQMLSNSFSFLPLRTEANEWRLVSDLAIARVLREAKNKDDRGLRLSTPIHQAEKNFGLELATPEQVRLEASVKQLLERQRCSVPVLVTTEDGRLIGIATPFDLL